MKWPEDYKEIEIFADKHDLEYEEVESLVLYYLNKAVDIIDKNYLEYCRKQNGMDYCKNCGLDKEGLRQLL